MALSEKLYSALNPHQHEIRVISLQPGEFHNPIKCVLSTISLAGTYEPYEALSYVWTAEPGEEVITLNGISHQVTKNLFLALRRLRRRRQALRIWIDALCINQNDLDEKSHQVALMGQIYRKCRRVYIWLGDCLADEQKIEGGHIDNQSLTGSGRLKMIRYRYGSIEPSSTNSSSMKEEPLSLLEQLEGVESEADDSGCAALNLVYQLGQDTHLLDTSLYSKILGNDLPDLNQSVFRAFENFALRPWWNRIWVIQEVLLPPEAVAVYGAYSLPWKSLERASKTIRRHSAACCYQAFDQLPYAVFSVVHEFGMRIVSLLGTKRGFRNREPFRSVIWENRLRQATNPQDMIYGLLGLNNAENIHSTIFPSSSLSKKEVYLQATIFCIEQENSLGILNGQRDLTPEWPSWIHDWSSKTEQRSWTAEWRRLRGKFYTPSLDRKISYTVQHDSKLAIDGIFIDRVASVGRHLSAIRQDRPTTLREWFTIANAAKSQAPPSPLPYIGGRTQRNAFWRTITTDLAHRQKQGDTPFTEPKIRADPDDDSIFDKWCASWEEEQARGWFRDEETWMFHRRFVFAANERAFFVTEMGYMGLGSPRVGDEVWVLFGGDLPFVLRPDAESDGYFLVGDCYVQGIMDGEAMTDVEEKKRTVVLR